MIWLLNPSRIECSVIEAFEFPLQGDAVALRSFKLSVDESLLMFTLRIWFPLKARNLSLLGQIISGDCLSVCWLSDCALSFAACA